MIRETEGGPSAKEADFWPLLTSLAHDHRGRQSSSAERNPARLRRRFGAKDVNEAMRAWNGFAATTASGACAAVCHGGTGQALRGHRPELGPARCGGAH